MRFYHYKQVMELVNTIKDVQSAELYADCQDGAEALLAFIIESDTDCPETIKLIEQYYELLYRVSIMEIDKSCLAESIVKISECFEYETKPHSIEVAFIAYKSSMSDSIESIYHAAKADPDCDAFWIPVPYCERNATGAAETTFFEGADYYDKSINITNWRDYDMEARHPDVVFTFYPYDSKNIITNINPNYYCEKMRDLTDLLVYVPYFVDVDAVAMDAFCLTPGCVSAHKTILASEKQKDTYIRIFSQHYGISFGKPEDKFIALGSPKYDKAINTKRMDYQLPQEWENIIGDRKVIAYISSVGCVLDSRDTYLSKLSSTLEAFRNRDDVLLWWRPHPLMEATISTMIPRLLQQYKEIVSNYIDEGWGIFDETSNVHRAVAWSDAFYGDWSSILLIFQVAGKPVMMADTKNELDRIKPCLVDCHFESAEYTLVSYINDVVSDNFLGGINQNLNRGIINADGTAGKAIYEYAKRTILAPAALSSRQEEIVTAVRDREEVEPGFEAMMQMLRPLSEDEIFEYILQCYNSLSEAEKDGIKSFYKVYPFWGTLDPEKALYDTLRGRAVVLREHQKDIEWLYGRLADTRSKNVLYAILSGWVNFDSTLLVKYKERELPEYYHPDVFPPRKDEVFVDVGAYTGDSVASFISTYGMTYKRIYCYEIAQKTFQTLEENLDGVPNVVLRQKAAGFEPGTMYIKHHPDISASFISDSGETEIEIVRLDDDITEPLTFIKMDIEGAEKDALRGCKHHIREHHPRLAICTYHGYDDLYAIPGMIDEMTPGYTFYMRYHGGKWIPTEFSLLAVWDGSERE